MILQTVAKKVTALQLLRVRIEQILINIPYFLRSNFILYLKKNFMILLKGNPSASSEGTSADQRSDGGKRKKWQGTKMASALLLLIFIY